jgi:hypothetical protein
VIGRAGSRTIRERKKTEDARSPPDHQRFRSLLNHGHHIF